MASQAAVARVQDDRLLALLRQELSGEEQQMFVTSFSTYLQHNPTRDHVVDLDDVWEQIGFTRKDNAKRAVTTHLEPDQYKVILLKFEEQSDRRGGANKELIMLTVDGFKELCLLSPSLQTGKLVRKYYIKMESVMLQYVRQVAEEKDRLLEDNARALQESARALEAKDAELEARGEELERFRTKVYEAVERLDKVYACKDAAQIGTDKHKIGKAIDDSKREATLNTALADGAKMVYVLEVSNGKLVEDIAKHALKRYHHAREHYNCKLDHTCDVYDIGGTVVDTLASSYEFITRDELFDKVVERLEACRLCSFACKGGFDAGQSDPVALSERRAAGGPSFSLRTQGRESLGCGKPAAVQPVDLPLAKLSEFVDENVEFYVERTEELRKRKVLCFITRKELVGAFRRSTHFGELHRAVDRKNLISVDFKSLSDRVMLGFGRPLQAKTSVTYKTVYNVYVNCRMKCSIRQDKEDPEESE
jgi:hypothetical protein